jgi:hypothetical protein
MLLLASEFLSHLDMLRTCAITGGKGTGKDLLAFELSKYYLRRGYRFTSNQRTVWSDPLYIKERMSDEKWQSIKSDFVWDAEKGWCKKIKRDRSFDFLMFGDASILANPLYDLVPLRYDELLEFSQNYGHDDEGFYYWRPDVRHRVLILSEGGRYLRAWKYFENMYEFTRKTDNYIFIPSIRLPHVDLCELIVMNIFPFKQFLGINGGVWYWYIGGQGIAKPKKGVFVHIPTEYGLYDTKDLSDSPTSAITAFTRQIQYIAKTEYQRDSVSILDGFGSGDELDGLASIARSLERSALSTQNKGRKK